LQNRVKKRGGEGKEKGHVYSDGIFQARRIQKKNEEPEALVALN